MVVPVENATKENLLNGFYSTYFVNPKHRSKQESVCGIGIFIIDSKVVEVQLLSTL